MPSVRNEPLPDTISTSTLTLDIVPRTMSSKFLMSTLPEEGCVVVAPVTKITPATVNATFFYSSSPPASAKTFLIC